jgi:ATP-dependent RNA circularization protein (DNA/RNA ligase family)
MNHSGIQTMATLKQFALRGEWLVQHSTVYDKEKYGHFYLFDVQWCTTGAYVHPDQWMQYAEEYDVRYIPILARLNRPTIEALLEYTKGPDEFGAKQKEGIVIKRFDFSNEYGRTTWGKLVSADFIEKMHAAMGATNDDPPEIRFVARIVTYGFIQKTMKTIEDTLGRKLVIQTMPRVLATVWKDAFTEELFDFVRKEGVSKFDFRLARRLTEQKTRDVALAYFNDVPIVWEHR